MAGPVKEPYLEVANTIALLEPQKEWQHHVQLYGASVEISGTQGTGYLKRDGGDAGREEGGNDGGEQYSVDGISVGLRGVLVLQIGRWFWIFFTLREKNEGKKSRIRWAFTTIYSPRFAKFSLIVRWQTRITRATSRRESVIHAAIVKPGMSQPIVAQPIVFLVPAEGGGTSPKHGLYATT